MVEQAAKDISWFLIHERFEYSPFNCPGHMFEHCGWDFRDEKCSSIKMVARCINCGKIAYGVREYRAVGPNSFDLEDENLIRSGILGDHYIDRMCAIDLKRLGY